jgi:uncharacterized protein (DUF1697 family)
MRYVALLRGINVGGRNLLRMADVRERLEGKHFKHVTTYIQSGNILFESDKSDASVLAREMEKALTTAFGHDVPVFLRSQAEMKKIVARAPAAWKAGRALRQAVAFLRAPLTAKRALSEIDPRPGVDSVDAGDGVLYLSTVMSRLKQTRLTKIVGTPIYRDMTIRSYSTCQKILALMEDDPARRPLTRSATRSSDPRSRRGVRA